MRLALIPARGGSKRVPRKNVRLFHGKPMIAYSIETALSSGLFDNVIVSTDDEEIADVALNAGAEVPFRRPKGLSDDYTPTVPVIRHALNWAESEGLQPTEVCCLYATAPFTTVGDLTQARDRLTKGTDFVFAAARFTFPVQRGLLLDDDGFVKPLFPGCITLRSQELFEVFHDAGQFYWGWPASFQTIDVIFTARARPFLMPPQRVQDIDTLEDWQRAERLYSLVFGPA
jgi:pseudaminic acid cytidylyltransferase